MRIHSDLKSFPEPSYHKYKYFIVFLDDYTSFAWVTLLRDKASAITALKQWLALIKNQYDSTIKEWMSDAGGEYKSDAFLKILKDEGITVRQSAPHTPQQNGHAERFMRTVMDKAQAMRLEDQKPLACPFLRGFCRSVDFLDSSALAPLLNLARDFLYFIDIDDAPTSDARSACRSDTHLHLHLHGCLAGRS